MRKAVLWIRRIVAASVFAGFVALFAGCSFKHLAFLAKWQFVPAVLAGSTVIVVATVVATLLFGRIYCGVCCPLGILQDIAFALFKHKSQGVKTKARTVARYVILAAFIAVGLCGFGVSWIEPYGLFGRIVTGLWIALTFGLAIFALAAWRGRVCCNWVCPVGTFLGGLSRRALFKLKINEAKCIGCRQCERTCRASAITIKGKGEGGKIDSTLCVQCRDCTVLCPKGAIGERGTAVAKAMAVESGKGDGEGVTRRSLLVGTAAASAALAAEAAEEKIFDGGFADVSDPGIDVRNASLKPAGSHSIKNFQTKCVGCQLCVKACPNKVLRPSVRLKDFGQPEMAFDKGYCTIDCTKCSEVCPAGAIEAIPSFMKENINIGEAVWHKDRCLASTEGVSCTACFRHCPVNAIALVEGPDGVRIPVVDADKCIGCGACEHVCPARPLPALTVKAYERHREIWPANISI
jgi:formate hydrogenlyase subunit 6/NADH:ubiquinone oxidoreductase subunit I